MSLPRRSWYIPVLGLALVAALGMVAFTASSDAAPQEQPVDHVVNINLTNNGNGVEIDSMRVTLVRKRGDRVVWRIRNGDHPFAIVVNGHDRAFPGSNQGARSMWGNGNKPVVAATKSNSEAGTFKYSIVVYNGTRQVILDPEIVIDPH